MKNTLGKMSALLLVLILVVSLFSVSALADVTSLPDSTSERVLNIYKYTPTNPDGASGDGTTTTIDAATYTPLANVEFEIYKVPADQTTSVSPTDTELAAIKLPANYITTVKTDENGLAAYSFGTGAANDGVYLIIEKANAAVEAPAAPFYLSMPLTSPDADAWLYTVTVYPKNNIPEGPGVDKDVTEIGNKTGTADVGDTVTWIIRGDVPADLYQTATDGTAVYAKNYSFTDFIDTRLDYLGNVAVKLYTRAGAEITLTAGTHYTATFAEGTRILAVSLTDTGKQYVQQNLGTGDFTPEIRVYFDTAINATAAVTEAIANDVTLNYTNSSGHEYEPAKVPNKPEVHTGGLSILKYKSGDETTKLAGATFMIARDAVAGDINTATITVGGEEKTVVYLDFYNNTGMTGDRVTEVTTGTDGTAVIYGLAYGDYYLVETKAPTGYNLLSAPIAVTVSSTSHLTANAVKVANSAKFVLPVTGGSGTLLFTAGGVLLIGIAILIIFASRRKKHISD